MIQWQPIATAPKTRQSILVYCAENRCVFAVYWCEWADEPTWVVFGGSSRLLYPPTHWMPMPDDPTDDDDPDADPTDIYTENGGES